MPEQTSDRASTVALNTRVEADFVAPLTAIRSALEILRDYPDLAPDERSRFIETALSGCSRLENGIDRLAEAVYAAGELAIAKATAEPLETDNPEYAGRIRFLEDSETVEVDFSGFRFSNSALVDAFHDVIDHAVERTRRRWYFLVNFRDCTIWPEAWIAFAHRGKKINASYSLGTVRYAAPNPDGGKPYGGSEPDFFESREAALGRIAEMRRASRH